MPTSTRTKKKADTEETKAAATKAANDAERDPHGGRPSVEPADSAPGKEKVDEDLPGQKLAAGGGSDVFMNTPLVEGIPVVVPITDALKEQTGVKTVKGVAVAAPVVSGIPEMISNAQAEHAIEFQQWKEGDIKSIHQVPGGGEVVIDRVQEDGTVKGERHRVDDKTYREFEKSFADPENAKKDSKAFYKKHFGEDTLIEEPK